MATSNRAQIYTSLTDVTAKDIMAELCQIPDGEVVRLMVGRPSLSIIARKLRNEAAARGLTDQLHDSLMNSLKIG